MFIPGVPSFDMAEKDPNKSNLTDILEMAQKLPWLANKKSRATHVGEMRWAQSISGRGGIINNSAWVSDKFLSVFYYL